MRPLALIRVETTGLNPCPYDPVVEVGALFVVPGQGILAEVTRCGDCWESTPTDTRRPTGIERRKGIQ